jgi:hypothetical protein
LQGRITNIEGSYVTENSVITTVSSRITASFESNGIGSSSLAAGVNQEAIARATADGFLAGQYTLDVAAGDIVTGMKITSATTSGTPISDITFRASNFKVVSGSGTPVVLLDIKSGGVVFQPDVQSDNFVAGSSGWRIKNTGDAEFNTVIIRQSVLHPLSSPILSPSSSLFESSINPTITQGSAHTIRYTLDGTYPVLSGGTASTITSGNSLPSALTTSTVVRAVAYNSSGQSSPEAVGVYTKTVGVASSFAVQIIVNGNPVCAPAGTVYYPDGTFLRLTYSESCGDDTFSSGGSSVSGGSGGSISVVGGVVEVIVTVTSAVTITLEWA